MKRAISRLIFIIPFLLSLSMFAVGQRRPNSKHDHFIIFNVSLPHTTIWLKPKGGKVVEASDTLDLTHSIRSLSRNIKHVITADSITQAISISRSTFLNFANFGVNGELFNATPKFKESLHFRKDTFSKGADFSRSIFYDDVIFDSVYFNRKLLIQDSKFHDYFWFKSFARNDCSFEETLFTGDAHFCDGKFYGFTNFSNAQFKGAVYFVRTHFHGTASFSGVKFDSTGAIDFTETALPDTLDLSYLVEIKGEFNLLYANYQNRMKNGKIKPIKINLYKSEFSRFKLDYNYFELYFDEEDGNALVSYDEKETVYEGLLKNFKDRGQFESYKKLDIEHQALQWKQTRYFSWLSWIPRWWWNFGYDKDRVFLWSIMFLIVFTTINYFHLDYLNNKIYSIDTIPRVYKGSRRLWYSFIYTGLIFFSITINVKKINFRFKFASSYLIGIYLIGLICLAYMANFVLTK